MTALARNAKRAALLLVVAGMLAACGFQLRGSANLPPEMALTRLQVADDSTGFVRELRLLLNANGVRLAGADPSGAATLEILRQRMNRRPLTITGQARVREYELSFLVDFRLLDAEGEVLIDREELRMLRDYRFDEQQILAATREEELLREDLHRSMAAQLIRRLEAAAR